MEQKVAIIAVILIVAKFILHFILHRNPDSDILLEILDWVKTAISALWIAFLVMYFIMQAFKIPSGSMLNTLLIKDNLFVNKFVYGTRLPCVTFSPLTIKMNRVMKKRSPQRGEVVVFAFPQDTSKDYVKRCVGLPGDKIEIRDKILFVNDEKQYEPYVIYKDTNNYPNDLDFLPKSLRNRDNFGPIIVPEDSYFVLGDNRDQSYDSRFWGSLHSDYLKGKAVFIYWPLRRIGVIK
ncbi:MAG: signal peptidase I [bacterium]|nr:signal peptidase I [bacterium]